MLLKRKDWQLKKQEVQKKRDKQFLISEKTTKFRTIVFHYA